MTDTETDLIRTDEPTECEPEVDFDTAMAAITEALNEPSYTVTHTKYGRIIKFA